MIRTVLGDINNCRGNVFVHEHIGCISNDMLMSFGKKWLDTNKLEKYAIQVLKVLKENLNLEIFVDGTCTDMGRNARMLKYISEKSGVKIVASSGLYFYPSMLTCARSIEELTEIFMNECENGLDGTAIKPGILKCAAETEITLDTKKRLSVMANVQNKTKLPMYAHCSHTKDVIYQMMQIFENLGSNPEKIIIGHTSRRLEITYLENILKEGYYICIDQSFNGDEPNVADIILKLCNKGYQKKILLSHDRPIYNDFAYRDRLGLDFNIQEHIDRFSFTQNKVVPLLKNKGIHEDITNLFLHNNALNILNF